MSDKDDKKPSLSDSDIITSVSRRGMMRGAGTAALGATIVGVSAGTAEAGTDNDNGAITDPGGRGRGYCRAYGSGVTDQDNGTWRDPGGNGRGDGRQQRAGYTDRDNGSWTDPGGAGRGNPRNAASGITDADGGNCSDPGGNGRG
ncbi:hypothetical protein GTA62_00625 [Roseobacter sp. HKCCD9010]|uniref:hypothetical protein n=1 Tax=Rhodobacterales TaxID=204455 RepID=UPI001492D89A|nr:MULTISPECIES: hypothetical protein [Rhodobacterales]MBF9049634.1 hypothetical protein [Rhodobacterales bacterium HKCCD4356]NNV11634.1 hypothetical protein [Roseobacter sp. HKCCD7357]NNV15818.1 hypothetical protein [Roseobacter sp. HKCCD8768]NNV25278.1 hypothetical protein [Roseobacter sp. HKCCD8192]NNV29535.1 hypothetical protein [Roseobacter sp. HKCCD9061]